MANTFQLKCVSCQYVLSSIECTSGSYQFYYCTRCHKPTYACDGMCFMVHSIYLKRLKSQQVLTSKLSRTIYRLRCPYHSSADRLKEHLKHFHTGIIHSTDSNTNTPNSYLDTPMTSDIFHNLLNQGDYQSSDQPMILNEELPNDIEDNYESATGNEQCLINQSPHLSLNESMKNYVESSVLVGTVQSTKILVCKSMFQKCSYSHRIDHISMDNISIFLNISKLVFLNGREGHEALIMILQLFWKYLPVCDSNWLPLPYTHSMFQSNILNPSNQQSLLSMLPIPFTTRVDLKEHAYCSLKEVLGYSVFFYGQDNISFVKQTHHHMINSNHVQQYLQDISVYTNRGSINVLCLTVLWSDGYDPNRSTKGNRKGAWIATLTFVLYDILEKQVYSVNTSLCAAGPGKGDDKEDHSSIFALMVQDYKELKNALGQHKPITLISGYHGLKQVNYYVCQMGLLMDNPERRSNYGLLQGNSKVHGVFGISCNFEKLELPFQACAMCEAKLTCYIENAEWHVDPHETTCGLCYGFSLTRLLRDARYKDPMCILPNDEDAPGRNLLSGPGRISIELLKSAWQYALSRFVHHNDWTANNVKEYLKVLCVNDKTISMFISMCRNYMNYQHYLLDPDDCDIDFLEQMNDESNVPMVYTLPVYPPIWDLYPIHMAVETPMHLQMNYIHHNLSFTFSWAKTISKGAQLIRELSPHLINAKSTNVDGFKVIPIRTDKFGGYVAENYRCLNLLAPWIFKIVEHENMKEPDVEAVPDPLQKPFHTWRISHLKTWLLLRLPSLERMLTKPELVALCSQRYNAELQMNPMDVCLREKLPLRKLRMLHNYSKNYCNSLMATDILYPSSMNRTWAFAAAYLSILDYSHKTMYHSSTYKGWITTYTLLGILRAPFHFQNYDWIRSLYEGGDMGEGIVKKLRPLSPQGIKDGWAYNLILNYYRQDTMSHLLKCCNQPLVQEVISIENKINHKSFVRYGSKAVIRNKVQQGCVISVLFFRDEVSKNTLIGSMIQQQNTWYFCVFDILSTEEVITDEYGYSYFHIQLGEQEYEINDRENKTVVGRSINIWKVGLTLPCYWLTTENKYYSFLTEDGYSLTSLLDWSIIT